MFDLNSLTEKEKSELRNYILLKAVIFGREKHIEKANIVIKKYEEEFGKIPEGYRELFQACIEKHFINSGQKIQDLHTPYHYTEYNPLCLKEILTKNEIMRFNDLNLYYSCFTPTMSREEITELNSDIFKAQRSNDHFETLSKGLNYIEKSYLIGMYDILYESLQSGKKITGEEAMNILKNNYYEAIASEKELLKPYMKSKIRK